MVTQGDGDRPAAASRRQTLGKKYRTTKFAPNSNSGATPSGHQVVPDSAMAAASGGAAILAGLLADGHVITDSKLQAIGEALAGLMRASLEAIAPLYTSLPALLEALLEPTVRLSDDLLSLIMRCLVWLVAVVQRQLVEEDLQAAGARDRAATGLAGLVRLLCTDSRVWMHCEGTNAGTPAPLAKLALEMVYEPPSVVNAVLSCPQRPGGADLLEGALQFCLRIHALVKLPAEFASQAASAATVAISAAPEAGPLKQANVLSLAESVQVLPQLASPLQDTQFARLQLVIVPRVTLAAKALGSPTLTLRLWGVKDCARLLEKAHGLPHSRGAMGTEAAVDELAESFVAQQLPQLLLGDLAHEEVLQRATPVFVALLQAGQLQQPTLTLIWSACSTKSAAVASVASSLLSEVLRSRHCPEALQESMLVSIGAVVSGGGISEGLASLLGTLSPIFRPLPAMADKFVLLLWEMLALREAPKSAHDSLQAALVEHYRGGSTEMLQQGLRLAALPLLALCGRDGATNRVRPSDAESTTPPTFGGGGGSSLVLPSEPATADINVIDLPLPKGIVAKGASKEVARLPEVALKLPARTAMRLIMELGASTAEASGVVVPGSSALLSQLESKLHLLQIAHTLVQSPYSDGPVSYPGPNRGPRP